MRPSRKPNPLELHVNAFARSMPDAYRAAFDDDAIATHAAIVARRGAASVRVVAWRELPGGALAVCVVANDRPGLLAQITAALVEHNLDVVDADAYCRTREDGVVEAVDFLEVRRGGEVLGAHALEPVEATIAAAFDRPITRREPGVSRPSRLGGGARLRFEAAPRSGVTVLSVEAFDRPGLLLAITQVLYREGLQIVGLRATT